MTQQEASAQKNEGLSCKKVELGSNLPEWNVTVKMLRRQHVSGGLFCHMKGSSTILTCNHCYKKALNDGHDNFPEL